MPSLTSSSLPPLAFALTGYFPRVRPRDRPLSIFSSSEGLPKHLGSSIAVANVSNSKKSVSRLALCLKVPRKKRNPTGSFLSSSEVIVQNSKNYDEFSSSSSSNKNNNNNLSGKEGGKIPDSHLDDFDDKSPKEGQQKIGEEDMEELNFYYDDEYDNENILDDYSLTEREWLKILEEEEDFLGIDEDASKSITLQQGTDDLEKELLELEESLFESKNGANDDNNDDFWMTGRDMAAADEERSTPSTDEMELSDWWSDQIKFSPGSRRALNIMNQNTTKWQQARPFADQTPLERALLQGVVPADAGVGSKSLPGDFGFDPLGLATKDLFPSIQRFLLKLLPPPLVLYNDVTEDEENKEDTTAKIRPKALIIRDYREAEIRHGRLAMLAAVIWPLQELIDRAFLPVEEYTFTVIYGEGTTLPFLVLLMTLIMMLLGYLDIFASQIKAGETGDAFLPGECFWDPLSMLDGAPNDMKRRMQERELMNGRMAMIAVSFYALQEALMHKPFIELPWNQLFFEPAYQVPFIRQWLDDTFGQTKSPAFFIPEVGDQIDFIDIANEVWKEEVGEPIIDKL
jgi:hypothetical protein